MIASYRPPPVASDMGGIFSRFCVKFVYQEARVLMLGLDGCGKTTLITSLFLEDRVTVVPATSMGATLLTFAYDTASIAVYDLPGQSRDLWSQYLSGVVHAVIFVVDSGDADRLDEAADALQHVASTLEPHTPLLIMANKSDLPEALEDEELSERLRLGELKQEWYVQRTSAYQGNGLWDGLEWVGESVLRCRDDGVIELEQIKPWAPLHRVGRHSKDNWLPCLRALVRPPGR